MRPCLVAKRTENILANTFAESTKLLSLSSLAFGVQCRVVWAWNVSRVMVDVCRCIVGLHSAGLLEGKGPPFAVVSTSDHCALFYRARARVVVRVAEASASNGVEGRQR